MAGTEAPEVSGGARARSPAGAAHVDPFEGTSTAKARRVRSREPDVEVTASAIVKGSLDDRPHKSRISSPGQLWPPRERVPVPAAPMTPLWRLPRLPWRSPDTTFPPPGHRHTAG